MSQVTVPRNRENPLIIPFSMLCPGISQNTKLHHLTLYKGQVWGEKSYLELCNHNVLNIVYSFTANFDSSKYPIEQNSELYVPAVPGIGFINDQPDIPWDSEILHSFAELTKITNITFHYFVSSEQDLLEDVTYQLIVGSYPCLYPDHFVNCVPHRSYYPFFIWTKECF